MHLDSALFIFQSDHKMKGCRSTVKTCVYCYVSNILKVDSQVVISSVAELSQEKLGFNQKAKFLFSLDFLGLRNESLNI